MSKPHVHAAVIKAWADGAKIQFQSADADWQDWSYKFSPVWSPEVKYRVKPETKTFRVALVNRGGDIWPAPVHTTEHEAYLRDRGEFIKWLTEPIEYEV